MKKFILFMVSLVSLIYSQAQTNCKILSSNAFYYIIKPGVNSTSIQIDGAIENNKRIANSVALIYLVSNCTQTPIISSISLRHINLKLEFVKIKSNEDEAGFDEQGKLQVVKAPKGTFLWKCNLSLENECPYVGKYKIIMKGTLGEKKFNTLILSPKKLRTLPMY